jgi:hypothetical protein
MPRKSNRAPAQLSGHKWRATQQATVDAILGPDVRKVTSRGSMFFNKDTWTARSFAAALCEWARLNPGATPDRYDVAGWLAKANAVHLPEYEKGITIASTPDELPKFLALALVGGGYHEAWHTEYSRRTPLMMGEVWPKVHDLWALVPHEPAKGKNGWAGLTGPLLEWSNIIEDIRIERLGCRKYPGSKSKMKALQDLILKMEEEGRTAMEHKGLPTNDDLAAVMGTFRDLGLGYDTARQGLTLLGYKKRSVGGYVFVDSGPLRPLLDRSIALTAKEDLESLWLAMEVVAAIVETSETPPEAPPPNTPPPGGGGGPPPPGQPEANNEPPPPGGGESGEAPKGPVLYKVGDRAVLKSGPHKGREVEVTRAGLPNDEGVQDLEFALVEPD